MTTGPLTRIRRGAIILASFFVVAVVVHHFLTQRTWLESIYWFVITVSTVGYGETSAEAPGVQAFTILVILVGMSVAAYVVGGLIQLWAAGEIERALGVRRMTREIDHLSGHTIVCGYGRLGKTLTEELFSRGLPFVVVEQNTEEAVEAADLGYLLVTGDATDEDVLLEAGVKRAKTLIVCSSPTPTTCSSRSRPATLTQRRASSPAASSHRPRRN